MTNEYIRPWTRDTNHDQTSAHVMGLTCMAEPHAADHGGPIMWRQWSHTM